MSISFSNTEIAFSSKNNKALKKAYYIFKMIESNTLVKIGTSATNFAQKINFPLGWIFRNNIFEHFCGGETVEECKKTINQLAKYNIGTILDYSVEGKHSEASFNATVQELLAAIKLSAADDKIPFSVFKVSGIAPFQVLEKISSEQNFENSENKEWNKVIHRVEVLCQAAFDANTPILIDAEESWIQPAIDFLAEKMSCKFNKNQTIVYNTIQLYRHDRVDYLKSIHKEFKEKGVFLGVKLVRGAYMEKERERAEIMNYESPINPTKNATDECFDNAAQYCIDSISEISTCFGTHNEQSTLKVVKLMTEKNIANNHSHIYFAQLLGMSDHISYNLSHEGYNVAKYVPYGPIKEVIPYLIRRAQENTSVNGQTGRELSLIKKERNRRKK